MNYLGITKDESHDIIAKCREPLMNTTYSYKHTMKNYAWRDKETTQLY